MTTAPPKAPRRIYTPDDLLRLGSRGKGYELVDGKLEAMNVSYLSSFVAGRLYKLLSIFAETHGLGWVAPEGTSFQCFPKYPDRVRKPDTCFHKLSRLSRQQATTEGHMTLAPDLVVEVISPRDRANRVKDKRIEWQEAGVPLIWLVYPNQQTVEIYDAHRFITELQASDTLTADPVLPGFAVPVKDLFQLPA